MSFTKRYLLTLLVTAGVTLAAMNADAVVMVQCPGDGNGNAVIDTEEALPQAQRNQGAIACKQLSGGDGFIRMADGKSQYTFGFSDLTGILPGNAIGAGLLNAQFSAPTLTFKEGQQAYLTLTNVGTLMRPDLFDPHTVHYHGFPQASTVYDGEPEAGVSINAGSSLTYYYNVIEPGTYLYHCHVEAAEHMQMGMLGNLYVTPRQNELADGTVLGTYTHHTGNKYVYNDGDGSTRYDVEYPIQISSFDPVFHDLHLAVQPLPFANMKDTYPMLNGRGYPDTVDTTPSGLPPAQEKIDGGQVNANTSSQTVSSLVTATAGQKILLRLSNVSITNYYTVGLMGLTMKVVGTGSHILKGPDGQSTAYNTNSVTLGGGETADVLIDTTGVAPGHYFLYTTNLNFLSNNTDDFGGLMTEIVINAAL